MRTQIISIVFLHIKCLITFSSFCQCCPYIGKIDLIPPIPSENESFKIITEATTPNQGGKISKSHNMLGDTLYLQSCYWSGLLTSPQTFKDTFNIFGQNTGNYVIKFKTFQSTKSDSCNNQRFQLATKLFSISGANTTQIEDYFEETKIYPNPTNNLITINFSDIMSAFLLDLQGKVVLEIPITIPFSFKIDAFPVGIYMIELKHIYGYTSKHRIIKN
ncbi:MAG: T9SS C-terminal target domain-containing protein [Bacteroidetes bacterium]|nr:MAG: T9SS C-terminal target domain-containing protein [Bacteroidota bacterium]